MKKKFPKFNTDDKFAEFIDKIDLTDYLDAGDLKPVQFILKEQDTSVTIRMSGDLIKLIKFIAKKEKVKYQKYIKMVLEAHVQNKIKHK